MTVEMIAGLGFVCLGLIACALVDETNVNWREIYDQGWNDREMCIPKRKPKKSSKAKR